ncbi:MAG TPA: heme ABC exporter ATP-binding protein CcmA [Anaerolineae bacterium]|nr:heme ABC exporter ATP-binding protein CcmA [Anaerolineae bacterium]
MRQIDREHRTPRSSRDGDCAVGGVAPPAILVSKVTKAFGQQFALRGVDLAVAEGDFLALFGPNGAGKTTLMRIMSSLGRPTGGSVEILGEPLEKAATSLRRHIGLISHSPLLYGDLTPDENLRFFARMYDLPEPEVRIANLLDQVGLGGRRGDPVRTFSRGMIQRLAIARAILHDPAIMLLDEPYTGLDLQAAEMLCGYLRGLATSGRTVVLTTHNLEQGLEMCSRIAILERGRIAWQGRRAEVDLVSMRDIYREATSRPAANRDAGRGRGQRDAQISSS